MAKIGHIFEEMIRGRAPACTPQIPMYSTVLGRPLTEHDQLDSRYWRNNLELPVLFSTTIKKVLNDLQNQTMCLAEIGPHCPLAGPLRQIIQDAEARPKPSYVPTLCKNQHQSMNIVQSAGRMFLNGIKVSFSALNGPGTVLLDLPPYPWDYSRKQWVESRVTKGWRMRQHGYHELLGSRVLESNDLEPSWRNILRLEDSPWLSDHQLSGCIVYPSAGHIAAVGEAIRQISGAPRYMIRNMFVKKALILDAQDDVELMTSLRPVTLTDVLDSDWYQFTVYSYNGTEWHKHCTGQVTAVHDPVPAGEPAPPFLRPVDMGLQYRSLRELGLDYGPHFQGLDGVTADPISHTARGRITAQEPLEQIDAYSVHPTIIDKGLQLMSVAATRGLARHLDQVAIPVFLDKVYCGCGDPGELRAQAVCRTAAQGNFVGDSLVVGATEVTLDIQGVKAFGVEADDHDNGSNGRLRSARVDWQPDIEFVSSLADLLPPASPRMEAELHMIEQICTLQIMITYRSIQNITPTAPYLLKYKQWLAQCLEKFQHGKHALVPETREWMAMDSEQQESLHASLSSRAQKAFQSEVFTIMHRFFNRITASVEDIFRGKVSMVETIMANNDLELFYNIISHPSHYRPFLCDLGRSRPHMRVLEIGAGTGGMTASTLECLETADGAKMFSEYVFTDISPGFFSAGRERFKNIPRMTFRALDITRDPVEQGFSAASFDLIVCSNVLHATPRLQTTLSNVRQLLVPGGYLFLQELCPETSLIDGIMGLLEGWWVGEKEGRVDHPYISPSRWDEELRMAGFTGAEAMAYDNTQPYQFNANIISRLASDEPTGEHISLLHDGPITESARSIENVFLQQGYSVDWCTLESPACGNIVSLLDLDFPFFDGISQRSFNLFRDFISRAAPKTILWVTRRTQMECEDPRWGQTLAVARSIRLESSIPFATVEMDPPSQPPSHLLVKVYQKFQSRLSSGSEPDYEYSIQGDSVYTCRYQIADLSERAATLRCPSVAKRLSIGNTGLLDTLHWVQDEPRLPGPGEVEIEVQYVALNFKDMMVAMGFVGQKDDLGYEASGIVRRVGPGPHAQVLRVGDRVSAVGDSVLRTTVVIRSIQCFKIPARLSLDSAVTIPCVYATAVYCLLTLGRLESGQSVLVHSACGGVGLAAIQVCQMMGAEIFATVGSEVKAQYLVDNHHIPRDRIFNSRNPSFKEDVLRVTGGRGVDTVLNSLSGECLHASWECVAEFGTMIEIGKRDMMGHGTLRMDHFQGNRSFVGFDLHHLGLQSAEKFHRTMQQVLGYIERGLIKPIEPKTIFEAHEVEVAFRYMQTGEHMGKILIRFPEDPGRLPLSRGEDRLSLSPEVSYLLIGGLGGLGQAVSRWMVECGARSLVFLSRSAGQSAEIDVFRRELKAMGCSITAVPGDVADPDDVRRALDACPQPVAGVIQMAMVLKDQTLDKMTYDEWMSAISPKVEGTWNLYRALQEHQLDFFVLFGSLVGHLANVGQANYGAANCFHGAFARYSRARGFPSAVLDLGVVKDIGYVSGRPDLLQRCVDASMDPLGEGQLVRALQAAIVQARTPVRSEQSEDFSSVIVGLQQLTNADLRATYQSELRLALFKEADIRHESGVSSQKDVINQFAAEAERDPSILHLPVSLELMTLEIARLVRAGVGEEPIEAAAEIPIDSMMTIEIRSWLRKRLNIDVPAMKIAKGKNIGGLSKFVLEAIDEKLRLKGVGTGQIARE
ncbi:KR-domain-containing protein [Aspergillus campestris IBT 28561]|uniref:KR-domain-containing protein n=1 Tax=Aspergillus campestris (strain IBT 28561) TaxID=1392248 RepID=A0A2I1CW94_ASPC2|nr:KR-domain-containing protein [Aspergillus campestris IBT 28561]PKY01888.1 KR-domain-containing protein [Aspergillus campestris IBT 28561]